jgi:hypothetical protein
LKTAIKRESKKGRNRKDGWTKSWKIYREVSMERRKKGRKKWIRGLHVSKENRGEGQEKNRGQGAR